MKKRTFLKNAVILTVTALILRGAGMFLRIYTANIIGAEGMGLHALIFTVYSFASALSTAGISLAVTRLISEDFPIGGKASVVAVLRKSLLLSVLLGTVTAVILYSFSDFLSIHWLCDNRAAPALRILALGLPFMSGSACFKGYFMARRNAKTPSDSQLLEQIIRIASVLLLLKPLAKHGLQAACVAVVLGNAVSEVAACIYLACGYKKDTFALRFSATANPHILPRFLAVFLPVAFTGHLNTALHTLENLLVPQALTRYTHDSVLGLSQFGMLKGMALPALFFPASFLTSMSALLVPEMSEYGAKKQTKSIARTASFTLRITLLSSILIAGMFLTYPTEIAQLLYKDSEVGFYIVFLAPIVPFMYLESIATGLLHGLNQQLSTLKYNMANSILRTSAVLFLVPHTGIHGFLWIMIFSNIYTSVSCLHRLCRTANIHTQWRRWIVGPFVCSLLAFLVCNAYNHIGSGMLHLFGGLALFLLVFLLAAYISGIITKTDFQSLFSLTKQKKQ